MSTARATAATAGTGWRTPARSGWRSSRRPSWSSTAPTSAWAASGPRASPGTRRDGRSWPIASPYYRTSRLYGLDPSGRLWLSVRGGRPWAPLRAAGPPGRLQRAVGRARRPAEGRCGLRGVRDRRACGARPTSARRSGGSRAAPDATAVATTTDDHNRLLVADDAGPPALDEQRPHVPARGARAGRLGGRVRPPQLPDRYAATGRTLLRSADGGVTWSIPR